MPRGNRWDSEPVLPILLALRLDHLVDREVYLVASAVLLMVPGATAAVSCEARLMVG